LLKPSANWLNLQTAIFQFCGHLLTASFKSRVNVHELTIAPYPAAVAAQMHLGKIE
jgi:hypothetical protein